MDALAPARSHQSLDGRSGCGKTLSENTSKLRELLKGGLSFLTSEPCATGKRQPLSSRLSFLLIRIFKATSPFAFAFLTSSAPNPLVVCLSLSRKVPKHLGASTVWGVLDRDQKGWQMTQQGGQTGLFFSAEAKTEGHVNPRIVRPWRYMYLYASSAFVWILAPLSE